MSSAYSTITSNVNLLLIDTKVITKNNPYVAYVSSINIPGRIATIRDSTGYLSTPNSIIVSTTKNVLFGDGTSSFSITQPFGYITLSSRDPNTWNIINTFAFPQPQGVANVSSLYVNDGIIANSFTGSLISTFYLNAVSISTINEKASTIFTSSLYANIVSTNILNAFSISTNQIKTSTIFTSTLTLNTAGSNGIVSLSNDGKTLLINNIPSGNFTAISTATTNFNMNGFSISNVNTLNTSNISSVNISTGLITTSSVRGINILTSNVTISNVLNGNQLNISTLNGNELTISTLNTSTLNVGKYLNLFDIQNNTFLNPIIGYGGQVVIQNDLLVSNHTTYTAGIVNSNTLDNCNNDITNVNNFTTSNLYINDVLTNTPLNPLTASNYFFVFSNSIFMCNGGGLPTPTTNTISNVYNIFNSNLYFYDVLTNTPLNPIIGSNNSIVFGNSINISNNSINNVLQTSNITDAATNIIVPFYFNMTNVASTSPKNINHNLGWIQVLTNQPTFSFSNNYFGLPLGGVGLVKFNFNLRSKFFDNFHGDASNGAIAFCYTLSNTSLNIEISGNTFNSNDPLLSYPNFSNPNKYTLSYEDVFNVNGSTTDTYCFNLYVYQSFQTLNPNYFLTDNHNITFQQTQQVTL